MDKKYYSAQTIFNASIMLFFGALFLIGTFSDKAIADFLYSPDSQAIKLATSVGVYPFFAASVFFLGALFERTVHSQKKKRSGISCVPSVSFSLYSADSSAAEPYSTETVLAPYFRLSTGMSPQYQQQPLLASTPCFLWDTVWLQNLRTRLSPKG